MNNALELESIACVLQKARKIVGYFKHSALATQELHKTQVKLNLPQETLIQNCPTKWDSTYYMCEGLHKNKTPILAVLNDTSVTKPTHAQNLEIASTEWSIIEQLITILKPLQCATTVLCSSLEVTISSVHPVTRGIINNHLTENILDEDYNISTFKEMLNQLLIRRFDLQSHTNKVSVQQIASFLDPRYKDLTTERFETERIKIKDFVKKELQVFVCYSQCL